MAIYKIFYIKMLMYELSEVAPQHTSFWQRFQDNCKTNRLGHAILLVGPLHTNLFAFAHRMLGALFCKRENSPCGQCQSCELILINEHPDLTRLVPEKPNGIIKIDQVRQLQYSVFTQPQLGIKRGVIINPAEKMNGAAANALLKILEEPPPNTYFILIAEQISTIPPTIISRCQQWCLPGTHVTDSNYLLQGSFYSEETPRGKIFAQLESIIDNLCDLIDFKISVNALAAKWAILELNDLIWLLYLLNSQMISDCFMDSCQKTPITDKVYQLANRIKPIQLFSQLDKLHVIIKNLHQTISVNQLLLLEELLIGYL